MVPFQMHFELSKSIKSLCKKNGSIRQFLNYLKEQKMFELLNSLEQCIKEQSSVSSQDKDDENDGNNLMPICLDFILINKIR